MLRNKLRQMPSARYDRVVLQGGLDQVTPELYTLPGSLRDAKNYETDINGGYTSIEGYERFDGQSKPSDAAYAIYDVTISGEVSVGDTITGKASSATAVVIAVVTSGDPDYLVITKIIGTFTDTENLEVSSVIEAKGVTAPVINGAASALLHAQYNNLAADNYRNDISAVTGSGDVLGVWMLNDVVYAFRNNAGGTAAVMYKSTSSGWSAVDLGLEIDFTSGGTTEIQEEDVIEGATSGATATVKRIILESGTWAGGDAAGRLILASQTGTFQSENLNIQGGASNVATIAGDSTAITLSVGGRFRFVNYNFAGGAGTYRMYGCDGVNRGFEFDGTTFVPIETGMATDTPDHVIAHKNHLFFSFGESVQHSSITDPYSWDVVLGAAEIAIGDTVTGFEIGPGSDTGGSLVIFGRNSIGVLYGNDATDWTLDHFKSDRVGGIENSIASLFDTVMLDDRGLVSLRAVQAYGNFEDATFSNLVKPFLQTRRNLVTDSCVVRDKNQYRIFFSDSYALYVTFDGKKVLGIMPVLLGDDVTCAFSLEDNSGNEVIMFGSSDGFVYQMDKGTSFDGDKIESYLFLHFVNSGSPRIPKTYKEATVEVTSAGYNEFGFDYDLNYEKSLTSDSFALSQYAAISDAQEWGVGDWDDDVTAYSTFKLDGTVENIAFAVYSKSDYLKPKVISGVQVRYLPRASKRKGETRLIRSFLPTDLNDLEFWYRLNTGISSSSWSDSSGFDRTMTFTNSPTIDSDGSVIFDGVDQYGQSTTISYDINARTTYLLMKQVSWTFEGIVADSGEGNNKIRQYENTPELSGGGRGKAGANANLAIGEYGIVTYVVNGSLSYLQVDEIEDFTYFTLDADIKPVTSIVLGVGWLPSAGISEYSNIQVKEMIVCSSAHSSQVQKQVRKYLRSL